MLKKKYYTVLQTIVLANTLLTSQAPLASANLEEVLTSNSSLRRQVKQNGDMTSDTILYGQLQGSFLITWQGKSNALSLNVDPEALALKFECNKIGTSVSLDN